LTAIVEIWSSSRIWEAAQSGLRMPLYETTSAGRDIPAARRDNSYFHASSSNGHAIAASALSKPSFESLERSHPCSKIILRYTHAMATISEVEKLAFDLPDAERAVLAAHLLRSLPSVLHDEDEGVAEALRRDAEFEADPEIGITLEQLDQQIAARRA
jgi:putative addiction module component (TIGR02574 family)